MANFRKSSPYSALYKINICKLCLHKDRKLLQVVNGVISTKQILK